MSTGRTILPATEEFLSERNGKGDYKLEWAYKNAILSFGSKADAEEVLKHYLINPTDPYAADILEIVGKWGDEELAKEVYEVSIQDNRLQDNFPEQVLEVLGQLKFEPAKPVLAHYAFRSSDYYSNKAAVLGLLNFNCEEFQDEITTSIKELLGKNLFPEFLPALVSKLIDRKNLLEELYSSGASTTSTDCNAGIFLAFSLCGEEGKTYFKNALFDPAWEAYYNAARYVLVGMTNLGISFSELMEEVMQIEDERMLQYHMLVIISLLEVKASSYNDKGESFETIYRQLLSTQIFSQLAERAGLLPDAEKVEELLIFRMREEVLLRNRR